MSQNETVDEVVLATDEVLLVIAQELRHLNQQIENLTYRHCSTAPPKLSISLDLSADAIQKLSHLLRT